jgi:CheY-like chemotaxis protein
MQAPLKILLVEDNEGDVEMTRHALQDCTAACTIAVANDGIEALDYLCKRGNFSSAETPQLILLDLNMPRMDGKRFLDTMKKDSKLKAISVIMFTSSQSPADIRECYERHISCYIVKPFGYEEFTDAVRRIASFWSGLVQPAA